MRVIEGLYCIFFYKYLNTNKGSKTILSIFILLSIFIKTTKPRRQLLPFLINCITIMWFKYSYLLSKNVQTYKIQPTNPFHLPPILIEQKKICIYINISTCNLMQSFDARASFTHKAMQIKLGLDSYIL